MILPYSFEDVLETNSEVKATFVDDVLILDNFYKNFSNLQSVLYNFSVPRWKSSQTSRNFVDYYDCRLCLPCFYSEEIVKKNLNKISRLIEYFFKLKNFSLNNFPFEFNFFKHKKINVSKTLQHFPHTDSHINCIVYIDNVSSGGTAIYDLNELKNNEHENLMFDISNVKLKTIIPAKPNRLVLFKGSDYHGGYIDDHSLYYNDWRINQVMFFS